MPMEDADFRVWFWLNMSPPIPVVDSDGYFQKDMDKITTRI
jgi:hypothetical protein